MFEKFLSSNNTDFRQRYEGTFGFYKDDKGKRTLCRLMGISEEVCVFNDARGVEFRLNADSESDIGFEFLPPKSQFYNTNEGAVVVIRGAARQFQRGISGKNTNIYKLSANEGLLAHRVDFPILEKVYSPKAPNSQEAIPQFEAAKVPSLAISNQFALSADRVYLFSDAVGTYSREGKDYKVKLNEPSLWSTEIKDAFRNLERSVEIV